MILKLFLIAAIATLCTFQVHQVESYVAAVVEFSPDGVEGGIVPSLIYSANLDRYEKFVREAKLNQSADIIVFPEYGLTTTWASNDRAIATEFAQYVPERKDNANPCVDNNNGFEYEAVRRLSCMARENGIYLVANLIERVDNGGDLLLHNTNIAFDSEGKVQARYRKFNLFGEFALNTTSLSDISVFEAFGARFGMITCFDIMFQHPAVTLVKQYQVTDIIFPTAWIQELPFLTGVQTQAMWAHALDVNFLAAGFNHPKSGKGGTGIFRGNTGRVVDATPWDISSFYLIGTLPVKDPKRRFGAREPIRAVGPIFAKNRPQLTPDATTPFYIQENLTNYQSALVELKPEIMHYHLCSDDLCCDLEVSGALKDETVFRFFVFSGEREFGRGLYKGYQIQTCALARCKFAKDPVKNCALVMNGVAESVELTHVRISGNFSKDALIGPNIVDGDFGILAGNQYIFRRRPIEGNVSKVDFVLAERINHNILTFGVWGRVYIPIDSGVTEYLRPPSWILPTSFAVGAAFIVVCLFVTVVKFTPNKYK